MDATEKLEAEVRKYGGDDGEEIIEAIRKLAEVDVEIKKSMDEIERIDEALPPKHNELADQINGLVKKVCEKEEEPAEEEKPEAAKETPEKKVTVEVHVVSVPTRVIRATPTMPLAMMRLMEILFG